VLKTATETVQVYCTCPCYPGGDAKGYVTSEVRPGYGFARVLAMGSSLCDSIARCMDTLHGSAEHSARQDGRRIYRKPL
jgi:hypothetical protein